MADKIDALDLRSQALQFVYYDMTVASLSTKTEASLDDALRNAERVTLPEQRGLLYLRIAEYSLANGDRDRALTLLIEAGRTAERVDEPVTRAGLLFSAAYELADLDSSLSQSIRMMKDAIHLLNDNQSIKIDQISLLRRVDLGCDKKNGQWYGSSDPLARFNLIETLVKLANSNSSAAEELAGNLVEGANRVRALAAITAAGIRAAREVPKGKAARRGV